MFFVNTGAEANENALKLACRITGRDQVVALEGGFHGRTAAAGAVTWGAAAKWYGFPRTPFDVQFLPRRDDVARSPASRPRTAAVIVEPIQGVGGAFDMGREYLVALRRRCDETGALLIFDEVQCGMGRTGQPFAANLYGVVPDMLTAAKALGAGFPVGALLCGDRAAAALKPDVLGTTFGGGPLACAVVEAVIDAIESENLLEQYPPHFEADSRNLRRRPGDRHPGRRIPARPASVAAREPKCSGAALPRHPGGHERRPAGTAVAAAVHACRAPRRPVARGACGYRRMKFRRPSVLMQGALERW